MKHPIHAKKFFVSVVSITIAGLLFLSAVEAQPISAVEATNQPLLDTMLENTVYKPIADKSNPDKVSELEKRLATLEKNVLNSNISEKAKVASSYLISKLREKIETIRNRANVVSPNIGLLSDRDIELRSTLLKNRYLGFVKNTAVQLKVEEGRTEGKRMIALSKATDKDINTGYVIMKIINMEIRNDFISNTGAFSEPLVSFVNTANHDIIPPQRTFDAITGTGIAAIVSTFLNIEIDTSNFPFIVFMKVDSSDMCSAPILNALKMKKITTKSGDCYIYNAKPQKTDDIISPKQKTADQVLLEDPEYVKCLLTGSEYCSVGRIGLAQAQAAAYNNNLVIFRRSIFPKVMKYCTAGKYSDQGKCYPLPENTSRNNDGDGWKCGKGGPVSSSLGGESIKFKMVGNSCVQETMEEIRDEWKGKMQAAQSKIYILQDQSEETNSSNTKNDLLKQIASEKKNIQFYQDLLNGIDPYIKAMQEYSPTTAPVIFK